MLMPLLHQIIGKLCPVMSLMNHAVFIQRKQLTNQTVLSRFKTVYSINVLRLDTHVEMR